MDLNQTTEQNSSSISHSNDNYVSVIDTVLNCVNEHLHVLINHMLDSADKILIEQADNTNSESERAKFINCTQVFQTEKTDISQLFFINLNSSLKTTHSTIKDDIEATLVDQDEMEEMIAITTMHSKAMTTYGDEVHDLEARLEYLELMCDEIFDKEALDPKHICVVFQKTIENIDLAIEAKLIFYKLFDQEVCLKLGVMYRAINQLFIDNGIMPEIMMNTTKSSDIEFIDENVSARVATYYDPEDKIQTDFIPRTKAEISRVVNEFMSGDMTITGDEIDLPESFLRTPTQQDLDGKNCYERKEVIKALSRLQHKLISRNNSSQPITTEQIKEELLENINQGDVNNDEKKVNLLDERNIDFVGLMFDAISDDKTITDIITNMIKRLQIPIMKVAMTDANLFDDEDHPARMIVNLLTIAGRGINTEKDRLFSSLEAIVDNILNEYDTDASTFTNAVIVLQGIIISEEQRTSKTEKQQQKKILHEHARSIVTAQFKMMSKNKKIPNKIRPLILKHWSTLMLNRYLRYGRDSSKWTQSVSLLRQLLKFLQPIQYNSQYTQLKNNHSTLSKSVNDALYDTKQNKQDVSQQVTNLKTYFLHMISSYNCELVSDSNEKIVDEILLEQEDDETDVSELQQLVATSEHKLAKLSSSTKPGAWYEIYTGEEKALRRLKLSIILNDAAQLIFVDRKGIKVIEKDAEEFAKELDDNRSRLITDHSTFDYALGKVMSLITN